MTLNLCLILFSLPKKGREQVITRVREVGPSAIKLDPAKVEAAASELAQTTAPIAERAMAEGDNKTLVETQWLIAAAAKWGWIRAGRDSAHCPYPLVTWGKSGARITVKAANFGDTVTHAAGSLAAPKTGMPTTSEVTMTLTEDVKMMTKSDVEDVLESEEDVRDSDLS